MNRWVHARENDHSATACSVRKVYRESTAHIDYIQQTPSAEYSLKDAPIFFVCNFELFLFSPDGPASSPHPQQVV